MGADYGEDGLRDWPNTLPDNGSTQTMSGAAARKIEDVYALSSLQQRMLFRAIASPEDATLVEQLTCTLRGPVDAAAMRQAWQMAAARHPALRTGFVWEKVKRPLQVVWRRVNLPWHEEDLRHVPADRRDRQCRAILAEQRHQPFPLTRPPLMRLALVRTADEVYHFAWTCHHLITDGWSLGLILGEVLECYEAFRRGAAVHWPPARPFRDYIAWLRNQDLRAAENFWKTCLAGYRGSCALPLPRPQPAELASRTARQEVCRQLSETRTVRLAGRAAAHRVPASTWIEGAWALLLARYTRQDDVVFGITVSGRPAELPGVESIVGPFINNVPLRVRMARQESVARWLASLQAVKAELEPHAHWPLEEIHRAGDVPEGGHLFETLVVFENYPLDMERLRRLSSLQVENIHGTATAHYPLCLIAVPGRRLTFRLQYDGHRFPDWVAQALVEQVCSLVEQMAADPNVRLADLALDSAAGPFRFAPQQLVSSFAGDPRDNLPLRPEPNGGLSREGPSSMSKPLEAMIVDSWGRPAPLALPGELVIRPLPEADGASADGEAHAARWRRTGIGCRLLPGGQVEYLGRAGDPVEVEGYRVDPEQMGRQLRAHPLVRDAAVVARPDPTGRLRLAAYVVPAEQSRMLLDPSRHALVLDRLRKWLGEHFPQAALPGSMMAVDEIPRTAGAEIDVDALPPPTRPRPPAFGPCVSPRDLIEAQLAVVWSELLGIHPVGIRDNFMELGGDSVLAVSLFSRIEDHFGRRLPLVALFQEPTIENLAGLLRRGGEANGQPPLVPIRPRGSRLPLYCVHPAGGTVFCYLELARHLDPDQPVYGIQARGIDGRTTPHTSVEAMADFYVETIRRHQPGGPYAVCGWSTGGIIAFEVARQLQSQGQTVALLALFDAAIPDPDRQSFDGSDLLPLLSLLFPGERKERLKQLERSSPEEQLEYFRQRAELAQLVVAGAGTSQAKHVYEVFQANMEAITRYRPRPYRGDIVVFRARQPATPMHRDPQLGWGRWAAGVEVHEVPGSHLAIFRPPAVALVARRLNEKLATIGRCAPEELATGSG